MPDMPRVLVVTSSFPPVGAGIVRTPFILHTGRGSDFAGLARDGPCLHRTPKGPADVSSFGGDRGPPLPLLLAGWRTEHLATAARPGQAAQVHRWMP